MDDGSVTPPPKELMNGVQGLSIRLVQQTALGISMARNTGISACRGSVILFVDSDCILEKDFLRNLDSATQDSPEDMAFQAALTGEPSSIVGRVEGLRLASTQQMLRTEGGYIRYLNTTAVALRRAYANQVPELFELGALRGEDTILLSRLAAENRLPKYAPQAVARHNPTGPLGRYLLKHFWIGYYTGAAREQLEAVSQIRMSLLQRRNMVHELWRIARREAWGISAFSLVFVAYAIEIAGRLVHRVAGMHRGRTEVLSVCVDPLRDAETMARVISAAQQHRGISVTYLTAWTLVQANRDTAMRSLLRSFDICYADGMGVAVTLFLTRLKRIKKVTANDFFVQLCIEAASRDLSVALIGGEEGVVEAVSHKLRQTIPSLRIPLCRSGYLSLQDEHSLIESLHTLNPDIVVLGMGQPRQEIFASRCREILPRSTYLCVGGLFDYLVGRNSTPPHFVRAWGLEWLWRLADHPRRFWRRYLTGLPLLGLDIVLEWIRILAEGTQERQHHSDND